MLAYLYTQPSHGRVNVRSRNSIEEILSFFAHALSFLGVFLLHLAYGLFLSGLERSEIHLGDAGQGAIEARRGFRGSLSRTNDLE